ncbi:MAG: hypothetical protein V3W44_02285 [Dehalococcoidales bacterium]
MKKVVVKKFDYRGIHVTIHKHTSPGLMTYGYSLSNRMLGAGVDTQEQAERLAKATVDSKG